MSDQADQAAVEAAQRVVALGQRVAHGGVIRDTVPVRRLHVHVGFSHRDGVRDSRQHHGDAGTDEHACYRTKVGCLRVCRGRINAAKVALTIAIKYGLRRRQFEASKRNGRRAGAARERLDSATAEMMMIRRLMARIARPCAAVAALLVLTATALSARNGRCPARHS